MWRSLGWIACLLIAQAHAHGGKLHPGNPEVERYIRVKVASCSKWVPASGRIKASGVAPAATRIAPVDVKGTVTLWQYLYGNCSYPGEDPSASAAFNVSITRGSAPLSNVTLDGLGMIGTCAENGKMPFFFNPEKKPVDDNENMLWFSAYTTKADGKVVGHGANDGVIRTAVQGQKQPVRSMVLVDTKTNSLLSCCDLVTAGPAGTNWTKALDGKGDVCDQSGTPMASKITEAQNATKGNSSMAHAGHDHAGHDHSGHTHAGHDHSGHNHSKPANASSSGGSSSGKAKSSAGAAGVSLISGVLAAAGVAVQLFL